MPLFPFGFVMSWKYYKLSLNHQPCGLSEAAEYVAEMLSVAALCCRDAWAGWTLAHSFRVMLK